MDYVPIAVAFLSTLIAVFSKTDKDNGYRPSTLGWFAIVLATFSALTTLWVMSADQRAKDRFQTEVAKDIGAALAELLSPYSRLCQGRAVELADSAIISVVSTDSCIEKLAAVELDSASPDTRYARQSREVDVLAMSAEKGLTSLRNSLIYGGSTLNLQTRTTGVALLNSEYLRSMKGRQDAIHRLLDDRKRIEEIVKAQNLSGALIDPDRIALSKHYYLFGPSPGKLINRETERYRDFIRALREAQTAILP